MKIVTTPMCQEILDLAGVSDYLVSIDPDSTDAELAVVLWETQTEIPSLKIKLNTLSQIRDSILMVGMELGTTPQEWSPTWGKVSGEELDERKKIKVKIYSNFLRDIVQEMGFTLHQVDPMFIIYPDYLRAELEDEIHQMGSRAVEIPSHKNAPRNPVERARGRYEILEERICMKL